MVCSGQQVSMYEMWKEWQVHEASREVYGAEVLVKEMGKMVRRNTWGAMIWFEEWTGKEKY